MVAINTESGPRYATNTRTGFVLVSTYSWLCMTVIVVVVRFVRGLIIHKSRFGYDDATTLMGTVSPISLTFDQILTRM